MQPLSELLFRYTAYSQLFPAKEASQSEEVHANHKMSVLLDSIIAHSFVAHLANNLANQIGNESIATKLVQNSLPDDCTGIHVKPRTQLCYLTGLLSMFSKYCAQVLGVLRFYIRVFPGLSQDCCGDGVWTDGLGCCWSWRRLDSLRIDSHRVA